MQMFSRGRWNRCRNITDVNLRNPCHPNRAIQRACLHIQTNKHATTYTQTHPHQHSTSEHTHTHTHTPPLVWMVTLRAGLRATGLFPAPGWNLLSVDLCQPATTLCGEVGTGIRGSPHFPTERSTYHILLPHCRSGLAHTHLLPSNCPAAHPGHLPAHYNLFMGWNCPTQLALQ